MNIAKNMEAIFIVAIGLAGVTSLAMAAVPAPHVTPRVAVQVGANSDMQVVTVTAKRLTAAQKAQLAD